MLSLWGSLLSACRQSYQQEVAAVAARRLLHCSGELSAAASLPVLEERSSLFTDLTEPASWYPTARALQRRIVAHIGPTNSGKTYAALESLKQAGTGVYCGPLRLLAWEVAERMNKGGVVCNLVTGQERTELPGARHAACTVEMASMNRVVDVAVLDEVQLLADRSRGWAFTRALLGLPARTLHVCGDPAALPLLERLCAEAGDELEVRQYERLSPLRASRRALGTLQRVGRGDCVVAFSRREVHAVRRQVEQQGKYKCCVVYGALPPEARSQQAVLFNTPRTGYNVLAASDAVGMGLNLAIRRVVFTSLSKYDGIQERPLTLGEIKQIAGRAGRFGSRYPDGVVTTLNSGDLPVLHSAMQQPSDPLEGACIFPRYEALSLFASQHHKESLAGILDLFASEAVLGPHYFFAHFEDMRTLAVMLKHLPLSLRESYLFALSPCDPADTPVATALLTFATAYARRGTVTPALIAHPPLALARSEAELQQLEAANRVYELYCWLAYRFEDAFAGREQAGEARAACAKLIDESIRQMGALSRSSKGDSCGGAADVQDLLQPAAAPAELVLPPAYAARQQRWALQQSSLYGQRGGSRSRRRQKALRWAESSGDSSEPDDEEQAWLQQEWQRRRSGYAKRRR